MNILDAFKKDYEAKPTQNTDLQTEVARQMKAIADYDANPEILDSKIKFNTEEVVFDEKAISKELYFDEDYKYPAESDDPNELLKKTFEHHKTNVDWDKIKEKSTEINYLEPCECNEVKVGDKLKIYNKETKKFDVVEVYSVSKLYNTFTFKPVVCVLVTTEHGQRKLSDPNVYYKVGSDEPITEFTFKNQGE